MMLLRATLIMVALSILNMSEAEGTETVPKFSVGQVWSLKGSPAPSMKVIIGRIEAWNDRIAIHVSVVGVPCPLGFPCPNPTMDIGHMPFDQAALEKSVDSLLATGAVPAQNFESGYEQWKAAKGGIYTITVSEAVRLLFITLSKGNQH